MQTDPTLLREIMLACLEQYPGWVQLSALENQFADRFENSILYHVRLLEEQGFVEVGQQLISAIQGAAPVHTASAFRTRSPPTGSSGGPTAQRTSTPY